MVHKNPDQLLRLIQRLEHPNTHVFIHVDAKIPIENFSIIKDLKNVYFIKNRVKCNWGGNSLSRGIIAALEEVANQSVKYDFINLLSAQDYPLNNAESIYNYLSLHVGTNFISYEESNDSEWWLSAKSRFEKYHLTDFNFKWKYFFERVLNKIAPKRKFPMEMQLYGGSKSTWWTINGDCAVEITENIAKDKKLKTFLKYCWGTDEFVIPSLIMNSKFKNNTVNNNLRYIDWSEGNAHPKLLTTEDFERLKNSDHLFARKFDSDQDSKILDMIDDKG